MQPHKELKTCTLLGASYTPKLINSWTLRKTGPPGKGHSSEPRPIFELLRGVCKFWLSWLDGVFRIIWKYGHPRAIPDANIINEKSRNTTELKKLLYRVKYWSPNACIVLSYALHSWKQLAENPHHAKKHKDRKGVWKPLLYWHILHADLVYKSNWWKPTNKSAANGSSSIKFLDVLALMVETI